MTTPNRPALDEQIAEVSREIGQRERLYPRWISEGKLKPDAADKKLADLRAALAALEYIHKHAVALRVLLAYLRSVNPYLPQEAITPDAAEKLLKEPAVRALLEALPEAVFVEARPLAQKELNL